MNPTNSKSKQESFLLVLFFLVLFLLLLPKGWFDFVWDDFNLIANNPYLRQKSTLWEAFRNDFWALSTLPGKSGFYRPVVTLSYWLDFHWFGNHPAGFHVMNLLFHGLTCLGIYQVARKLDFSFHASLLSVALFSFHPVQASALGTVSSRTDLLATLFFIWGVWFALSNRWTGLFCFVFFLLGLLSKESIVLAPFLLLLLAELVKEEKWKPCNIAVIASFGAVLVYMPLRLQAMGFGTFSFGNKTWLGGYYLPKFVGRIFYPVTQSQFSYPALPSTLFIVLSVFCWVGAFVLLWVLRSKSQKNFVLLAFFLFTLLPVSNLLPFLPFVRFADLMLYLPMIAVAYFFGSLWESSSFRWMGWVVVLLCLLVFYPVFLSWKDGVTFWKASMKLEPKNRMLHLNLSNSYKRKKLYPKALEEYALLEKKLVLSKERGIGMRLFHNRGNLWVELKQDSKALLDYEKAFQLSGHRLYQAAEKRGWIYWRQNKLEKAEEMAKKALLLHPRMASHWHLYGAVMAKKKEYQQAAAAWMKSLSIQKNPQVLRELQEVLKKIPQPKKKQ